MDGDRSGVPWARTSASGHTHCISRPPRAHTRSTGAPSCASLRTGAAIVLDANPSPPLVSVCVFKLAHPVHPCLGQRTTRARRPGRTVRRGVRRATGANSSVTEDMAGNFASKCRSSERWSLWGWGEKKTRPSTWCHVRSSAARIATNTTEVTTSALVPTIRGVQRHPCPCPIRETAAGAGASSPRRRQPRRLRAPAMLVSPAVMTATWK